MPANQSTPEVTSHAADMLDQYASFIRNDVKADDFERHPYVPEIEETAQALRDLATPARGGDELREALDEALALIQEAKGLAGPGSVTDHLDFAESWLDKITAALASTDMAGADHLASAGKPMAAPDRLARRMGAEFVARDAASPVEGLTSGEGWVYWNPDAGEEYADNHPVRSGECVDAERIRQSTPQEDVLWRAMQEQFSRAEALAAKPTTLEEEMCIAVADVLNAAWSLCDDTAEGDSDKPQVPREAWKRLSDALDTLEAIIPESEQPCRPGVAARLLGATPKATATASVREGEALAGYRAAVSFISADSWDGCSDCIEILRAARSADWQNDQAADLDETARQLARIRRFALTDSGTAATIGGERA